MRKFWRIAWHEYSSNVRRKGFLFGTFGMPILLIVLMTVVGAIAVQAETGDTSDATGYVDQSGVLDSQVDRPDNLTPYATVEEADAALAANLIGAYFIVPADYMSTGAVTLITARGGNEAAQEAFSAYLVANLDLNLPPAVGARLLEPVNLQITPLDTGRTLTEGSMFTLFMAPLIFVVIFMIASQITSGYLMSGVVEEKSNRIMEMLITSVTPGQLLGGKMAGLGALGLTQLGIWITAGVLFVLFGQGFDFLRGFTIPNDIIAIIVIYFILGYILTSGVMAGIGAVVGSEQESRQIGSVITLPLVIPFFLIFMFITDPNNPIVIFLSLFPLTSPTAILLRIGFSTVPLPELALSVLLLAITALFVAWASARVFRWSILMYGKRPSLRQILRAIRTNQGMQTSATGERAG